MYATYESGVSGSNPFGRAISYDDSFHLSS